MSVFRDLAYAAGALLSGPLWGWRLWRTGKWRTDWPGRFGRTPVEPDGRTTLLIHAVSVGEVNAVRRLVGELTERHGERLRIVIAATTDTGVERARKLFEPDHPVVRFPLDLSFAVRRFLDAVRPDAVALVELEVWPTFVAACERRGVPVGVINGRLSQRSYRRYRLIRPLVRSTFAKLHRVAAQDRTYADRFIELGVSADRLEVTGNMKWDTAEIRDEVPGAEDLAAALGIERELPLIVCGSTGPGEEAMLLEALEDLRDDDGEPVQLLLAPRKPERFGEVFTLCQQHTHRRNLGPPIRRTEHPDGARGDHQNSRLFLLDTIGELGKAYALADVAVVGRSFCPLYGSDMIEPIALGCPTVIGPNVADFREPVEKFLAGGGLVQLDGIEQLAPTVRRLLRPEEARTLMENGRAVIRQEQGATRRHAGLLEAMLGLRRDNGAPSA